MISMTFGQPMIISKTDAMAIPLSLGQNNEHVFAPSPDSSLSSLLIDTSCSKMAFFSESLKLFQIAGDLLPMVYPSDKSSSILSRSDLSPQIRLDNLDFNTFLQIDDSLHRWIDALPSCLQLQAVDSLIPQVDPIQTRQSVVLRLR